jgi:hypothetical protein
MCELSLITITFEGRLKSSSVTVSKENVYFTVKVSSDVEVGGIVRINLQHRIVMGKHLKGITNQIRHETAFT